MTSSGTVAPPDSCAALTSAAAALATGGPDAVRPVLAAAVRDLGLRSAVLRHDGELRAAAGEVVHAVPARRGGTGPEAVVELPLPTGTGTLTVVGARPSQLPLLRGLCAVLALGLRGAADPPLPQALLDAADADADEAADDLHDGPVQELVFARFAADAAVRGGDVVAARDAVQSALQSLRRALWLSRPRGAGEGGLPAALEQLSARLVETGRQGLALDLEDGVVLTPRTASVAYRLVQAAARGADAPVRVSLGHDGTLVRLTVGRPPAALERWTARARALGAALAPDPSGGVVLSVPAHTETEAI